MSHTHACSVALYPGTFDPITNGHMDIIGRAAKIADSVIVGVAASQQKGPMFSVEERVAMVRQETQVFAERAEIRVLSFSSLLMHFAEEVGAGMIVRGLRAVSDFEYEFQMTAMNQRLNSEIETVFLMADPLHQAVASRLVKEIARYGGDISKFVPSAVEAAVKEKLACVVD